MEPQRVDPGKGLTWFKDGWHCFIANPVMWIVLIILYFLILFGLQLIPLLGPLAFALASPALAGGLLFAARESLQQHPVEINQLFIGLTDPQKRIPLLLLGAIWLGLTILFGLAVTMVIGGAAGIGMLAGSSHEFSEAATLGAAGLSAVTLMLVTLAIALAFIAVMIYAIPLVMFHDERPVEAMKSSVQASIVNVIPLLVFGIVYLVLAVIASIPLGLGMLVLLPVTIGALYASFRDIYAIDDDDPANPSDMPTPFD
jgi:uncharacterized membrane protein